MSIHYIVLIFQEFFLLKISFLYIFLFNLYKTDIFSSKYLPKLSVKNEIFSHKVYNNPKIFTIILKNKKRDKVHLYAKKPAEIPINIYALISPLHLERSKRKVINAEKTENITSSINIDISECLITLRIPLKKSKINDNIAPSIIADKKEII